MFTQDSKEVLMFLLTISLICSFLGSLASLFFEISKKNRDHKYDAIDILSRLLIDTLTGVFVTLILSSQIKDINVLIGISISLGLFGQIIYRIISSIYIKDMTISLLVTKISLGFDGEEDVVESENEDSS